MIVTGPLKGQAVSSTVVSNWIRQVVTMIYLLVGQDPHFPVMTLSASWAFHQSIFVAQICYSGHLVIFPYVHKVLQGGRGGIG